MSFTRDALPFSLPTGDAATEAYVAIGFRLAAAACSEEPNIENTLMAASIEGMSGDYRVLAILTEWLGIHSLRVNADRLIRIAAAQTEPRVRAYWAAIAVWLRKDPRFARLINIYSGPPIELVPSGSAFAIARRGEDHRFHGSALRVAVGNLRERASDVATPSELLRMHAAYRCRVLLGPSYRADMWALLDKVPALTPTALAHQTYGSFATAWQVKRDWKMLNDGRDHPSNVLPGVRAATKR